MNDPIATFTSWLEKNPGDRFALYSLALAYRKAGRTDEALRVFGELLALHPTSGAGHFQLGTTLLQLSRPADAAAAWRRGLDALRGQTDAESRRSFGEIERALDEVDDPG